MSLAELMKAGHLEEAIAVAKESVRSAPEDTSMRIALAELLCFQGDWERADKQLDTASTLDAKHALGIAQFRQLLRAEVARHDVYETGRTPELICELGEDLKERLRAALLIREGQPGEAAALLNEVEQKRRALSGTCNGQAFSDIRDGDDLLGDYIEVLSGDGRCFWFPLLQLSSLAFEQVERLRDLLFRQVTYETHDGVSGVLFWPVLYHGSAQADSVAVKLGRETAWVGSDDSACRGLGQRMLYCDQEPVPVLEIEELTFAKPGH